MKVKGPNWKKIWKNQKEFLHHKSQKNKDLYCGRTCIDWCFILLFCSVFYSFVFGFALACYQLFVLFALQPSGNYPYRRGYVFGNEKIIESEHKQAYHLAAEVEKFLQNSHLIQSSLDFPMLSTIPKRYGDDDIDPGADRNIKYAEQLTAFYEKLNSANTNVQDCKNDTFAAQLIRHKLKKPCGLSTTLVSKINTCKGNDSSGWNLQPQSDEDGTIKSFSICFMVKLNKVVGFVPVALKGADLKNEFHQAENDTQVFMYPKSHTEYEGLGEHALPLQCWFGASRKGKEIKDLAGYFGNNFAQFTPGNYMDLRQYPFMGNLKHPVMPTVIQLNFRKEIKPEDVITFECRVLAKNIPFHYRMLLSPANKYGHFRSRIKHYYDKNARKSFFKIEK